MLSWNEVERLKRDVADFGRYSVHIAIVLSLVFSFTAVAILSKKHLTNQLWAGVAAFAVPMPIALYFRNRSVPSMFSSSEVTRTHGGVAGVGG